MKQRLTSFVRASLALAGLGWGADVAYAQFPGGGNFGGGTTGRSSTSQRQYPNNTAVGEATISIDPDGRRIVVVTDDETNKNIGEVITNLDRPKPQVLIKVVFLEVTYNNNSDIGVEGAWRKNGIGGMSTNANIANVFGLGGLASGTGTNGPVLNAFNQPTSSFVPSPPGAGLYQILGNDYQVTLRAIAQAGRAEILSRPSILARNGQPATISIGQQVPLITGTRFDTTGNQINTVTYQAVGIILKVTPFITPDGMVEMIVAPETSEVADRSQWVPITSGAGAVSSPVINQRSADTVVVVPDGQPVVIGGLIQKSKSSTDSKIPFLGDIPLLGNLFKRKQKADGKTELMIFLTPHVIQAPSQLAGLSQRERSKLSGPPSEYNEQQLNQFLDGLPVKDPEADKPKSKSKK
jgi:general secretion pathway protein D